MHSRSIGRPCYEFVLLSSSHGCFGRRLLSNRHRPGKTRTERYWAIFEHLSSDPGYADYLGACSATASSCSATLFSHRFHRRGGLSHG